MKTSTNMIFKGLGLRLRMDFHKYLGLLLVFLIFCGLLPNHAEATKTNKCIGATGWTILQIPMSCGICYKREKLRNLGYCENSYPGCTEGQHVVYIYDMLKCSRGKSWGEAFDHWYSGVGYAGCLKAGSKCLKICSTKGGWACYACVVVVAACVCAINDIYCNTCIFDYTEFKSYDYGCIK